MLRNVDYRSTVDASNCAASRRGRSAIDRLLPLNFSRCLLKLVSKGAKRRSRLRVGYSRRHPASMSSFRSQSFDIAHDTVLETGGSARDLSYAGGAYLSAAGAWRLVEPAMK